MCTTDEKLRRCLKTHMTLNDVTKVVGSTYKTLRPEWNKLRESIESEGYIVHKYGIPTKRVLEHFRIDITQLEKLAEFEKKA